MTDYQIIKILLEELEGQMTHLRVSRGYGAGHPHWEERSSKQMLGDHPYEEEEKQKQDTELKPIEISKAFRK